MGRPPEGAVYVRLPPLGAWSWSGPGFSQAPAEASPFMRIPAWFKNAVFG